MEEIKIKTNNILKKHIPKVAQFLVAIFIVGIMLITFWNLILISIDMINIIIQTGSVSGKDFIVEIFYAFIMLEIIFMGIKYFEENFHIPMRYFIYIGATTLTKDIFINPDNAIIYTGGILLLIIALFIYKKIESLKKDNANWQKNHLNKVVLFFSISNIFYQKF